MIHTKLRPVLDLLIAARPHQRDYMCMRAFVRAPPYALWALIIGSRCCVHVCMQLAGAVSLRTLRVHTLKITVMRHARLRSGWATLTRRARTRLRWWACQRTGRTCRSACRPTCNRRGRAWMRASATCCSAASGARVQHIDLGSYGDTLKQHLPGDVQPVRACLDTEQLPRRCERRAHVTQHEGTGVYRVSRAGGRSTWAHLGDAVCGKPWLLVCTVCHERVGGRRGRTWVTPYAASRGYWCVPCVTSGWAVDVGAPG